MVLTGQLGGSVSTKQLVKFLTSLQGELIKKGTEGADKLFSSILLAFKKGQSDARAALIQGRYDRDFCDAVNRSVIA